MDIHTYLHTYIQTDRQTYRQTDRHTYICLSKRAAKWEEAQITDANEPHAQERRNPKTTWHQDWNRSLYLSNPNEPLTIHMGR